MYYILNVKKQSDLQRTTVLGITTDLNGDYKNSDFACCNDYEYYGYRSDGKKVRAPCMFHSYPNCFKTNDIVTMIVDFEEQDIEFKLNGDIMGVAYNGLPKTAFRIGVRMKTNGDSIKVLHYKYMKPINIVDNGNQSLVLEDEKQYNQVSFETTNKTHSQKHNDNEKRIPEQSAHENDQYGVDPFD